MNNPLQMIRNAVAYESRSAPPQASHIKKRKVGNRNMSKNKSMSPSRKVVNKKNKKK
jgi:hypothetical protein